jgi:phosphatidylserine/phosphatidylglycerophosphate/cardiolipin synthase-like enzyme
VMLDKSQESERYTSATFLRNHGVPVFIDDRHAIAHNKVMLIDGDTVITGSFNFTKAAEERNAENLLILRGAAELSDKYRANFETHLAHSRPYTR